MKEFTNLEDKAIDTLLKISHSKLKKNSHLFPDYGEIEILAASNHRLNNVEKEDLYPAIILLRVVLAANRNYNAVVRKNIERIKFLHPDLKSFNDLDQLLKSLSQEEFYKFWGHKNLIKYDILKNILSSIKLIREKYNIDDDFLLMVEWAKNIDLKHFDKDPIGRIKNVALATVQHLRMDFGIDTVKPDQRVIEVLEREFVHTKVSQRKAIRLVEELSKLSSIKTRTIDLILVNYGSGYYDNRKYNSLLSVKEEIASRLINLGVADQIVLEATELPYQTIFDLKQGLV